MAVFRRLQTVFCALPFLFGCDDEPTDAKSRQARASASPSTSSSAAGSAAPPAASSVAPAAPAAAPATDPEVELLEAGSEPRQVLEYDLSAGKSWEAIVRVTSETTMRTDGSKPEPVPVPTVSLRLSYKVVAEPNHRGVAKIRRVVDDIGFDTEGLGDKQAAKGLSRVAEEMKGYTVVYNLSKRGVTSGAELEGESIQKAAAAGMMSSLRAALGQIATPLPDEPVGRGARWKTSTESMDLDGMDVSQTSTFELRKVDGREIHVVNFIEQTGQPGPVESARVPPGYTARLESMKASGKGAYIIDLGSPFLPGILETTTDTEMIIDGPEGNHRVVNHNVIRVFAGKEGTGVPEEAEPMVSP